MARSQNSDGRPQFHLRRISHRTLSTAANNVCFSDRITFIGRGDNVHYLVSSAAWQQRIFLSRRHCRLVRSQADDSHRLIDSSMTGVYVNDVKIAGSCVLEEGDVVTFGHPKGDTIQAGTRVRQPDSEHQFVFEACSCTAENHQQNVVQAGSQKRNKQLVGAAPTTPEMLGTFRVPKTVPKKKANSPAVLTRGCATQRGAAPLGTCHTTPPSSRRRPQTRSQGRAVGSRSSTRPYTTQKDVGIQSNDSSLESDTETESTNERSLAKEKPPGKDKRKYKQASRGQNAKQTVHAQSPTIPTESPSCKNPGQNEVGKSVIVERTEEHTDDYPLDLTLKYGQTSYDKEADQQEVSQNGCESQVQTPKKKFISIGNTDNNSKADKQPGQGSNEPSSVDEQKGGMQLSAQFDNGGYVREKQDERDTGSFAQQDQVVRDSAKEVVEMEPTVETKVGGHMEEDGCSPVPVAISSKEDTLGHSVQSTEDSHPDQSVLLKQSEEQTQNFQGLVVDKTVPPPKIVEDPVRVPEHELDETMTSQTLSDNDCEEEVQKTASGVVLDHCSNAKKKENPDVPREEQEMKETFPDKSTDILDVDATVQSPEPVEDSSKQAEDNVSVEEDHSLERKEITDVSTDEQEIKDPFADKHTDVDTTVTFPQLVEDNSTQAKDNGLIEEDHSLEKRGISDVSTDEQEIKDPFADKHTDVHTTAMLPQLVEDNKEAEEEVSVEEDHSVERKEIADVSTDEQEIKDHFENKNTDVDTTAMSSQLGEDSSTQAKDNGLIEEDHSLEKKEIAADDALTDEQEITDPLADRTSGVQTTAMSQPVEDNSSQVEDNVSVEEDHSVGKEEITDVIVDEQEIEDPFADKHTDVDTATVMSRQPVEDSSKEAEENLSVEENHCLEKKETTDVFTDEQEIEHPFADKHTDEDTTAMSPQLVEDSSKQAEEKVSVEQDQSLEKKDITDVISNEQEIEEGPFADSAQDWSPSNQSSEMKEKEIDVKTDDFTKQEQSINMTASQSEDETLPEVEKKVLTETTVSEEEDLGSRVRVSDLVPSPPEKSDTMCNKSAIRVDNTAVSVSEDVPVTDGMDKEEDNEEVILSHASQDSSITSPSPRREEDGLQVADKCDPPVFIEPACVIDEEDPSISPPSPIMKDDEGTTMDDSTAWVLQEFENLEYSPEIPHVSNAKGASQDLSQSSFISSVPTAENETEKEMIPSSQGSDRESRSSGSSDSHMGILRLSPSGRSGDIASQDLSQSSFISSVPTTKNETEKEMIPSSQGSDRESGSSGSSDSHMGILRLSPSGKSGANASQSDVESEEGETPLSQNSTGSDFGLSGVVPFLASPTGSQEDSLEALQKEAFAEMEANEDSETLPTSRPMQNKGDAAIASVDDDTTNFNFKKSVSWEITGLDTDAKENDDLNRDDLEEKFGDGNSRFVVSDSIDYRAEYDNYSDLESSDEEEPESVGEVGLGLRLSDSEGECEERRHNSQSVSWNKGHSGHAQVKEQSKSVSGTLEESSEEKSKENELSDSSRIEDILSDNFQGTTSTQVAKPEKEVKEVISLEEIPADDASFSKVLPSQESKAGKLHNISEEKDDDAKETETEKKLPDVERKVADPTLAESTLSELKRGKLHNTSKEEDIAKEMETEELQMVTLPEKKDNNTTSTDSTFSEMKLERVHNSGEEIVAKEMEAEQVSQKENSGTSTEIKSSQEQDKTSGSEHGVLNPCFSQAEAMDPPHKESEPKRQLHMESEDESVTEKQLLEDRVKIHSQTEEEGAVVVDQLTCKSSEALATAKRPHDEIDAVLPQSKRLHLEAQLEETDKTEGVTMMHVTSEECENITENPPCGTEDFFDAHCKVTKSADIAADFQQKCVPVVSAKSRADYVRDVVSDFFAHRFFVNKMSSKLDKIAEEARKQKVAEEVKAFFASPSLKKFTSSSKDGCENVSDHSSAKNGREGLTCNEIPRPQVEKRKAIEQAVHEFFNKKNFSAAKKPEDTVSNETENKLSNKRHSNEERMLECAPEAKRPRLQEVSEEIVGLSSKNTPEVKRLQETSQQPMDSAEVTTDSAEVTTDSAEVTTDCAEVTTDSAEVATDSAEVATDSAEVTTDSAEVTTDSAEVTTDSAEVATDSAEVTTDSAEVTTDSAEVTTDSAEVTTDSAEEVNNSKNDTSPLGTQEFNTKDIKAKTNQDEQNTTPGHDELENNNKEVGILDNRGLETYNANDKDGKETEMSVAVGKDNNDKDGHEREISTEEMDTQSGQDTDNRELVDAQDVELCSSTESDSKASDLVKVASENEKSKCMPSASLSAEDKVETLEEMIKDIEEDVVATKTQDDLLGMVTVTAEHSCQITDAATSKDCEETIPDTTTRSTLSASEIKAGQRQDLTEVPSKVDKEVMLSDLTEFEETSHKKPCSNSLLDKNTSPSSCSKEPSQTDLTVIEETSLEEPCSSSPLNKSTSPSSCSKEPSKTYQESAVPEVCNEGEVQEDSETDANSDSLSLPSLDGYAESDRDSNCSENETFLSPKSTDSYAESSDAESDRESDNSENDRFLSSNSMEYGAEFDSDEKSNDSDENSNDSDENSNDSDENSNDSDENSNDSDEDDKKNDSSDEEDTSDDDDDNNGKSSDPESLTGTTAEKTNVLSKDGPDTEQDSTVESHKASIADKLGDTNEDVTKETAKQSNQMALQGLSCNFDDDDEFSAPNINIDDIDFDDDNFDEESTSMQTSSDQPSLVTNLSSGKDVSVKENSNKSEMAETEKSKKVITNAAQNEDNLGLGTSRESAESTTKTPAIESTNLSSEKVTTDKTPSLGKVKENPAAQMTEETPGLLPTNVGRTRRRLVDTPGKVTTDNAPKYMEQCQTILSSLQQALDKEPSLKDISRVQAWKKEAAKLGEKMFLPETIIAVVGDTGAGKSSLMNALLDHSSVLPTSGMRACTAVVVEVSNNDRNKNYQADVEFLSRKEWDDELRLLLTDLIGEDGKAKRKPDPQSEAGIAWSKIKAVYGRVESYDVLSRLPHVRHLLGTTKHISKSRAREFRSEIDKYVDSMDAPPARGPGSRDRSGGQLWPIVKRVKVQIPNCDVCSSGAILVDLPGVRDSNAARDNIAKQYFKNCNAIWIVASIHRAVDDKTAKELLGEGFRRQLLMDGQYGSIAFICTKTDDLRCSEIIRALNLEEEVEQLENEINALEVEKMSLTEELESLREEEEEKEDELSAVQQEVNDLKEEVFELEQIVEPVDITPDEEVIIDDDDREKLTSLRTTLEEKQSSEQEKKTDLKETRLHIADKEKEIAGVDRQVSSKQRQMSVMCAKARNQYSQTQIRADFKAGIREMKRKAGLMGEDADSDDDDEEEQVEDQDEEDIARGLRVFTVSSTEYLKLTNKLTRDGPAQVFSSVQDTQIPALREFVHEMTNVRRQSGTEKLIRSLGSFVSDIASYLLDEGTKNHGTRMSAKTIFEHHLGELKKSLQPVLGTLQTDVDRSISICIHPKLKEGVQAAASMCQAMAKKWGAPTCKENRQSGGLHYSTYKATVRRSGVYKSPTYGPIDMNEDLSSPLYNTITISWQKVFDNGTLFFSLDNCKQSVLRTLKEFLLKLRTELQALGMDADRVNRVGQQQLNSTKMRLDNAVAELKEFITGQQREISRVMTPAVQNRMEPVYETCTNEAGPGSFNRIRNHMDVHVAYEKDIMFDQASQILLKQLADLEVDIVARMQVLCDQLCEDLAVLYEPFWEAPVHCTILKKHLMDDMLSIHGKVKSLFDDAELKDLPPLPEPVPQPPAVNQSATGTSYSFMNRPGSSNMSTGTTPTGINPVSVVTPTYPVTLRIKQELMHGCVAATPLTQSFQYGGIRPLPASTMTAPASAIAGMRTGPSAAGVGTPVPGYIQSHQASVNTYLTQPRIKREENQHVGYAGTSTPLLNPTAVSQFRKRTLQGISGPGNSQATAPPVLKKVKTEEGYFVTMVGQGGQVLRFPVVDTTAQVQQNRNSQQTGAAVGQFLHREATPATSHQSLSTTTKAGKQLSANATPKGFVSGKASTYSASKSVTSQGLPSAKAKGASSKTPGKGGKGKGARGSQASVPVERQQGWPAVKQEPRSPLRENQRRNKRKFQPDEIIDLTLDD